jgi:GT2 family glycosyltransferase
LQTINPREGTPMDLTYPHPSLEFEDRGSRIEDRVPFDPRSSEPRLSVVIVNYRQWEGTATLARQVLATAAGRRGAVEVMVVDNHSPRHPLLRHLRRQPGVSLRRWGANHGFARAVNEGCRLSRGGWLLLVNPDVTLPEGFVEGALEVARNLEGREPRTGVVGFRLCNSDGTRQLSSGGFPTLAKTLAGLLLPRERRKYSLRPPRRRCRVPWVTGCCLLVRRACLEEVGGLDDDFFLYYEDVDLCRRAGERGWSVWYEPALFAVHHRPLHARPVLPHLRAVTRHGLLTYGRKHWPRWQFRLLAGIVGLEARLRKWWARWNGDARAAGCFDQLGKLTADLVGGRQKRARRRLQRLLDEAEAGGVS